MTQHDVLPKRIQNTRKRLRSGRERWRAIGTIYLQSNVIFQVKK